jgi:hypothetical protein
MYPLFRCHRRPRPVHGRFVRDGSAPPALAARASRQRHRQRRPRGRALSSGGQSIPNINCTMMSSLCSSYLLVYVIVVVGVVLPKYPSQSRRSATSKKLHASASSSSYVVTLLPLLPSQSSRLMNHNNIDRRHRHRCRFRTPHRRRCGAHRCCDTLVLSQFSEVKYMRPHQMMPRVSQTCNVTRLYIL